MGLRALSGSGLAGLVVASALLGTGTASADLVTAGESNAFGVSSGLSLTLLNSSLVTANVAGTPSASGTAPAPYNTTNTGTLSGNVGLFALGTSSLLNTSTGLMTATASSNVDGLPGTRIASASDTINTLSLGVVNTLNALTQQPLTSFLNVSATTIDSSSSVSGNFAAFSALGSAPIENLKIAVQGVTVLDLTGQGVVNFAPNTAVTLVTPIAGLSIVLNEQIPAGNGAETRGMTTNAIDIRFNNVGVSGVGTLNGSILIGHSEAQLTAVPEPASLALCGIGLGLVFATYSRRALSRRMEQDC